VYVCVCVLVLVVMTAEICTRKCVLSLSLAVARVQVCVCVSTCLAKRGWLAEPKYIVLDHSFVVLESSVWQCSGVGSHGNRLVHRRILKVSDKDRQVDASPGWDTVRKERERERESWIARST
jgi:hypothetical protein